MRSPTWNIAFGDYDLGIDRRALTLTLREAKTNTVWGTNVSLGWMDVQDRATQEVTRHDFGALRQLTVSEKAGPQGKRILWGLDLDGIPVDLYVICSQREIQIVVEANRDSRTHRVVGFGLLPGLCRVPDGAGTFRLLPLVSGTALLPSLPHPTEVVKHFTVWDDLAMPLIGAVQQADGETRSAIGLFTDSAYAQVADDGTSLNFEYTRDPERRRLDLRVLVFPQGDAVSVARAYREKQIASNNHVTLRRKLRDNPALEQMLGKVLLLPRGASAGEVTAFAEQLENKYGLGSWQRSGPPILSPLPAAPLRDLPEVNQTRWEELDDRLAMAKRFQEAGELIQIACPLDWAAIAVDFWPFEVKSDAAPLTPSTPLLATVYHDSVVPLVCLHKVSDTATVLRALLHAAAPAVLLSERTPLDLLGPACTLLSALHHRTFSSFLTTHRFLTQDSLVEEAVYSDKTRIVINRSETATYDGDDLTLPPLGFYVRHAQLEAHDALRVGGITYPERRWRIAQSRDGKPLEQSTAIRQQEFTVPVRADETERQENPLQY